MLLFSQVSYCVDVEVVLHFITLTHYFRTSLPPVKKMTSLSSLPILLLTSLLSLLLKTLLDANYFLTVLPFPPLNPCSPVPSTTSTTGFEDMATYTPDSSSSDGPWYIATHDDRHSWMNPSGNFQNAPPEAVRIASLRGGGLLSEADNGDEGQGGLMWGRVDDVSTTVFIGREDILGFGSERDFHPHGIDLSGDGRRAFVVNHGARAVVGEEGVVAWEPFETLEILDVRVSGGVPKLTFVSTVSSPDFKSINAVAATGDLKTPISRSAHP